MQVQSSRDSSDSRPPSWRPPPATSSAHPRSAIYSSPRKGAVHFQLPGEERGRDAGSAAEEQGDPANQITAVLENAPNISPGKVETRLTLLSSPGESPARSCRMREPHHEPHHSPYDMTTRPHASQCCTSVTKHNLTIGAPVTKGDVTLACRLPHARHAAEAEQGCGCERGTPASPCGSH